MRNFFNSLKALFKRTPATLAKTPPKPVTATEAAIDVKPDDAPVPPANQTPSSDLQGCASLWEEFAKRLNTQVERRGTHFTQQVTGLYRDYSVQAGLYRASEKGGGRSLEEGGAEWFAIRLTPQRNIAASSWSLVYGVESWEEGVRPDWFLVCEDRALREQLQSAGLVALMRQRQPIKTAFGHDQEVRFDAEEGTLTFRVPLGFALLAPSATEFCEELDLLIDLATCLSKSREEAPRQPAGAR